MGIRFIFVLVFWASISAIEVCPQNQERPIGIFEDHMDFWEGVLPGEASFDASTGEYTLKGADIEFHDVDVGGGHFVYSGITNETDFTLEATIQFDFHETFDSWPGGYLWVFEDNAQFDYDPQKKGANFGIGVVTSEKRIAAWHQRTRGTLAWSYPTTNFSNQNFPHDNRLKLEKTGANVKGYYFNTQQNAWILYHQQRMAFADAVIFVGLGAVSSRNFNEYITVVFSDIQFNVVPADVHDWEYY